MGAKSKTWRNRIAGTGEEAPDQLVANPRNWRTHPGNQREALRGSLDTVGWVQQIVVNRTTGHVVDGHARVEEALTRGEKTVPVLYVELTEDEEAFVLATLDPIGALATADAERLNQLLADVTSDSPAIQQMLADLAQAAGLYEGTKQGLTDPDDVPEVDGADVYVKPGDLWLLGDHRLLCGDSTKSDDVLRAMNGKHADLCLTDPPYGASIEYAGYDDTPEALSDIIAGFLPLAREVAPVVALTSGLNNIWLYPNADWVLCWFYAAGTGRTPWGFSAWQPVLVYGKDPKLSAGEGSFPDGYNWPMTREDAAERKALAHVVPKPTSSWTKWMDRLSNAHTRVVFDPFIGSGTTIIAAEQTRRVCYGIEIEPRYVQVAKERWEHFTGKQATLAD